MKRKKPYKKGDKINNWLIISDPFLKTHKNLRTNYHYKIQCKCGKIKTREHLEIKRSSMCISCFASQKNHGMTNTKPHVSWSCMKNRCYNKNSPDYKNYGARGIKVFEEWINNFEAFYSYIGDAPSKKHSLDRIDVNGDYEPGNIRWASQETQRNNKRNSRYITYNGEKFTIPQWERKLGFNIGVLKNRIMNLGWDVERAFNTPVRKRAKIC